MPVGDVLDLLAAAEHEEPAVGGGHEATRRAPRGMGEVQHLLTVLEQVVERVDQASGAEPRP